MEPFIDAVLCKNWFQTRSINSLTWKFKRIFIVVENELREDAKAFIKFKKVYLRNLVCRHGCRCLHVLDVNMTDGALRASTTTVLLLTMIFFS